MTRFRYPSHVLNFTEEEEEKKKLEEEKDEKLLARWWLLDLNSFIYMLIADDPGVSSEDPRCRASSDPKIKRVSAPT